MGRPRKDPSLRPKPRPVRLDREVDDALCRLAVRHDVSIHALLKLAARRLVRLDSRELERVIVGELM
jgi:hypothetical protein